MCFMWTSVRTLNVFDFFLCFMFFFFNIFCAMWCIRFMCVFKICVIFVMLNIYTRYMIFIDIFDVVFWTNFVFCEFYSCLNWSAPHTLIVALTIIPETICFCIILIEWNIPKFYFICYKNRGVYSKIIQYIDWTLVL